MLEKSRKFPIPYKPHPAQKRFFEKEIDVLWVGGHPTATFDVEKKMQGIVKNIVVKRAFGFVIANGQEYFFHKDDFNGHWDDLVNDWNNKDKVSVEFEVTPSPKGPRASKVRRTDFPNQAV